MKPKITTLTNGLRLLVIPQPAAATATMLVLVGTGSKYESKAENGLSHFLEHLCFKGTTNLPTSRAIVESFDRVGAVSNAFTSMEYTGYFAKGGPSNVPMFVDVLSDIYMNSIFPDLEVQKEKGVIIEEINMYEDMPQQKVGETLLALMYGDQPAGWTIAGSKENVRGFTRGDVVTYKAKHYHAANTIVVIAGAVMPTAVRALITEKFKALDTARATKKKKTMISKTGLKSKLIEKKSDQAHIAIGFHSVPFGHMDGPAATLLATLLGRSMSSRLFQVLREEMGAAYYVSASQDAFTDHGLFEISAGIDKTKINEVFARIVVILKDLKDTSVSADELHKAREYTLGIQRLGLESSDDIAGFYGVQLLMRGSLKTPAEIVKEYKRVTPNDIQRVARMIFRSENCGIAAIGPFKALDTGAFLAL